MRVLIIDNYDSFVYNLAQYVGELGADCTVARNDKITMQDIREAGYDAIIISPGPGTPEDPRYFGVCMQVIRELGPTTPLLGVCLGHQGIIHAFGGRVVSAGCVRHGKTSPVSHAANSEIFRGVPSPFEATRYHSLVGDRTVIPDELEVTARAEDDGEVMGVRHKRHPIEGVQFHPESIMTEFGMDMLANFLRMAAERAGGRKAAGGAVRPPMDCRQHCIEGTGGQKGSRRRGARGPGETSKTGSGRVGGGGAGAGRDHDSSHAHAMLERITSGRSLGGGEMRRVMESILEGGTDDAYNAAFLKGLSAKGETDEELLAMLDVMMQKAVQVDASNVGAPVIDVCGTGGDMQQTYNISTAASFIAAAASETSGAAGGCAVAKHGNRSSSGVSGSADIFEMLGCDIGSGGDRVREILERERICFIFAQRFHPAMRHVAAARRSLGTRTAFNLLGPLANPARVSRQLVGVSSADLLERIPRMLIGTGRCEAAMSVMSVDGMDELSTSSSNTAVVAEAAAGGNGSSSSSGGGGGGGARMTRMIIKPEEVGLHRSESASAIRVADAPESARCVVGAIDGTASRPVVETAVLNAAGALVVSGVTRDGAGGPAGLADMVYAVEACMEAVSGGRASARLDSFVRFAGEPAMLEEIRHGA